MQKQKTPIDNICYLTLNCPPNLLILRVNLRLEPGPPGNSTAGPAQAAWEFQCLSPLSHGTCSVTAILWFFNFNAQETGQKRFALVIISKNK